MTTTKVTGLTGLNVRALTEIGVGTAVAASAVEFDGTPGQAIGAIRSAETADTRRSLNAVIRKLRAGEASPHVRVTA